MQQLEQKKLLQTVFWSLLLALCCILYFLPVLKNFGTRLPGSFPDQYSFVWNFWILPLSDSLFFTDRLYHPYGASLHLHSISLAISYTFSTVSNLNPYQQYTLACLFCFLMNGFFSYRLFLYSSKSYVVAGLLSIICVFQSFAIGHLDAGHLNFLAFFPLIAFVHEQLVCFEENKIARYCITGPLCLLLLSFVNWYYLYFAILLAVLHSLFLLKAILGLSKRSMLAGSAILVLLAVRIYPVYRLSSAGSYSADHNPVKHSADILDYLLSSNSFFLRDLQLNFLNLLEYQPNLAESKLYLGISLLVALVTLLFKVSSRSKLQYYILAITGLSLVLSWGPKVHFAGDVISTNPVFSLLSASMPAFPSVPARFGFITCLFILLIVASLSRALVKSRVVKVLLLITIIELLPGQVPYSEVKKSEALSSLREDQSKMAAFDCASDLYAPLAAQLQHQKKIGLGFLARRPRKLERKLKRNAFNRYVKKGVDSEETTLKAAFDDLQVQAVVCQVANQDALDRLKALRFLEQVYSDSNYSVFAVV